MNRLRSKTVWITVAALIFFILKNYGLLECVGLTADSYNELVTLIFAVLMGFGILNNPTDKKF